MMLTSRVMLPLVTVLWLFGAAPAPAQGVAEEVESAETLQSEPESVVPGADVSQAPPAKKSAGGIEYRSGGVGKEERDALHLVAKGYTLKIVLAAKQDSAFAKATVRILDASGKTVLEAADAGPLVFVDLPAGGYKVAATAYDQTKEQSVAITAGKQTAISFSW